MATPRIPTEPTAPLQVPVPSDAPTAPAPTAPAPAPAESNALAVMEAKIAMLTQQLAMVSQPAAAPAAPAAASIADASFETMFANDRARTKALLDAQPKRKVRLRQAPKGQPAWPDGFAGVNGYNFQFQRGVEVEVPETIYQLLDEAGEI